MKIKCPIFPWCDVELEFDKKIIGDHLFSKHAHDQVCMELTDIIFKINENIESLDKQNEYDIHHGYSSPCTSTQIDLLKSLLDDQK